MLLALDLCSTFLNIGIIGETFQQSAGQYSFRYILGSSVNVHKSSIIEHK